MENLIKESIYKNLNINPNAEFAKSWGKYPSIKIYEIINSIFMHETGPKAIKSLNRGSRTFNEGMKRLFPEVKLTGRAQTWKWWLISQSDYKKCSTCQVYKQKVEFSNSKNTIDALDSRCKECSKFVHAKNYAENKEYFENYRKNHKGEQKARSAKRRALILQRTVKWSELDRIKNFYKNCPEGCHVDHYYPLQGKTVCGLHVLDNLQYLTVKENLSKGNKMPEEHTTTNKNIVSIRNPSSPKSYIKDIPQRDIENFILAGGTWVELAEQHNFSNQGIRNRYETISGKKCSEITVKPEKIEISAEEIEYWVLNFSWTRASKELGLSDNGLRKRYTKLTGLNPKTIKDRGDVAKLVETRQT